MATSRTTPNADEIVSEMEIAAAPGRVFEALVDPKQVVQWWGEKGVYRCTRFESDPRVGGKWRATGVDGQGRDFEVSGEYLEIDRPRALEVTWKATWTGDVQTKVRWELEAVGSGTRVRVRHSGLAAHPEIANAYRGWPRMLGWLRGLVERGETVEDRSR